MEDFTEEEKHFILDLFSKIHFPANDPNTVNNATISRDIIDKLSAKKKPADPVKK